MAKEGYIYIYKCIVGSNKDICKIGVTKHLGDEWDRLRQHLRTLYYGFTPYTDFASGKVIATGFKVTDMVKADGKVRAYFSNKQISTIEIYNIDYDEAIEELYNLLSRENLLVGIIRDGFSSYVGLNISSDQILDDFKDYEGGTTKNDFMSIKEKLVAKYKGNFPDELLNMLRKKKDFKEQCPSHYNRNGFVDFTDDLVLDINFSKAKKREILEKLNQLL